ncbi:hypothetical protein [Paenibacillus sp. P3E]|uniref:hypothetical protein n=1 Tax=Paenibacillus sp. P3E TaxID=1349435 RepID=UPI003531DF7D
MEGDITLDATDLMNHILCKGGILTFAKNGSQTSYGAYAYRSLSTQPLNKSCST